MSLPPNISFGLRLAMLIVETGRHPYDYKVPDEFLATWMENGVMDDGEMDDPVAFLLMRKRDGALFRLAEDQKEPEGDYWRFQWPQDSKHDTLSVLSQLNAMLEGKVPIGDITI